jgi:hypothetical protein
LIEIRQREGRFQGGIIKSFIYQEAIVERLEYIQTIKPAVIGVEVNIT